MIGFSDFVYLSRAHHVPEVRSQRGKPAPKLAAIKGSAAANACHG